MSRKIVKAHASSYLALFSAISLFPISFMMMDNCSLATRLPQLATNPNQNLSTSPMEEDNATTLGLQSLAPELIANVMMFLDFGDVLKSSRVCLLQSWLFCHARTKKFAGVSEV